MISRFGHGVVSISLCIDCHVLGSSRLWNRISSSMHASMKIMHLIMRDILKRCHGYEVAVEKDGAMLCFQEARFAVQFMLEFQFELVRADWPEHLLSLEYGTEKKNPGMPIHSICLSVPIYSLKVD